MAIELFFGNWLFTLICFGTGAPGGVFLPVLTLGALGGDIFAEIGASLGIFSTYWATLLIVFGMAAFFAAVIKAPVTGCLLIMETTGQFAYLLTLTIVSGAAFMASDICGGKPIFSALMNRRCKH
jgi:H+/Cl- antiporter ClcA